VQGQDYTANFMPVPLLVLSPTSQDARSPLYFNIMVLVGDNTNKGAVGM